MNEDFNNSTDSNEENNSFQNNIRPTMSPIAAGFVGLAIVFVLYQIGGSLITLIVFGFDLESADINAMRLMTIAGQLLFILLPALIFSKLVYQDVGTIIRAKIPSWKEVLVFLLGFILLTPILQSYLYLQNFVLDLIAKHIYFVQQIKDLLDSLDKVVTEAYSELLQTSSLFESIFIVIVVAVVPAVCEETFFRGFVQKSFEFRLKPVWAAMITATFFALYHFNPYGMVALFALGFFFGFAAYKSGSILIPLMIHFLNNLLAIISYFIFGEEELVQSEVVDPNQFGMNIFLFIIFLILFIAYIVLVNRNYHKIAAPKEDI